jgi:pimeloyl-ACP methyl ester carboxylesterase
VARRSEKLNQELNLTRYPAVEKKYEETIIFVHFFDGSQRLIRKHIELVNELGFDAYAYDVTFHLRRRSLRSLLPRDKRIGLKNFWTDDVEYVLDQVPGPKIIFAFSNPASAAIEATARRFRQGITDVRGIICDSGPFVELVSSAFNLARIHMGLKNPLLNIPVGLAFSVALSPNHANNLHEDLEIFPADFPILSIRGWQDKLVPIRTIEKVFEPHSQLDVSSLVLPEAGHIKGLKDFPELYKPAVEKFLAQHAHKA